MLTHQHSEAIYNPWTSFLSFKNQGKSDRMYEELLVKIRWLAISKHASVRRWEILLTLSITTTPYELAYVTVFQLAFI